MDGKEKIKVNQEEERGRPKTSRKTNAKTTIRARVLNLEDVQGFGRLHGKTAVTVKN